jgi:hypothetical protein
MRNPPRLVRSYADAHNVGTRRIGTQVKPIALCGRWVVCVLSGMSINPLSYVALKFPAPVCHDCGLPMVTVTTIFHHATPDVMKVVSYRCQNCGCRLGAPRLRGGGNHHHSPLQVGTYGEIESPASKGGALDGD